MDIPIVCMHKRSRIKQKVKKAGNAKNKKMSKEIQMQSRDI
jgi:hypothetical protein